MSRHTVMNYRAPNTVRIPDLMGGINTRDSLSMINDNQLTDSLNMWWRDGVLKTRPGMNNIETVNIEGSNQKIEPRLTDIYICGKRLFYYSVQGLRDDKKFWETKFWLQGEDGIKSLPVISDKTINFVCHKNNTVYAFTYTASASYEIWKLEFEEVTTQAKGEWAKVEDKDYYIPTVMAHCKSSHKLKSEYSGAFEATGTYLEGFNILGEKYKMIYSTVNLEADVENDCYEMTYNLIESAFQDKYKGKTVEAKYIDKDGKVHEHSVTLQGKIATYWVWEESSSTDGLKMGVCGHQVRFYNEENKAYATLTKDDYIEDNLEIIAPYISEEKYKVFDMTQCTWFGGASAGLKGGTRLFLCGNKQNKDKALVMWSGLNEPLYFPENSYFYVGDNTQAVTGFGKQSDMLVIFKERGAGMYYTQYTRNNNITANDLINQSVIDYASSAVYFPLTQIHDTIGCDIPSSIQLCRNRLVWACSDGKVYTLVGNNQYSERNVYCVSDMIGSKLKQKLNSLDDLGNVFSNVFSADWEGHYLLFVNNCVFVMDYESYGYAYVASHTKTDDAQKKIPWWYWEFKDDRYRVRAAIRVYNSLFTVTYPIEPNGRFAEFQIDKLDTSADTDNSTPISSMLQTKLFNFSLPSYKKNVQRVNLSLGNNCGEPIKVEFITEYGSEEQEIIVDGEQTEAHTAGYITNKAVFPCIKAVKQFGVRLSCEGNMAADGMSLDYVILGGAR